MTGKIDFVAEHPNNELDKLLQKLEPINRAKVSDLPDAPDKNTIYTLQQEWIYLYNNWVRIC